MYPCFRHFLRRFRPVALLPSVALALALLGLTSVVAQTPKADLLLTGARILDARSGRYLAARAVVVSGTRISAILGEAEPLPAAAQKLDLPGSTLVPGLGDLAARAVPSGGADADFHYLMSLAHGVTMLRVLGAPLTWASGERTRAAAGTILAPRLWIAGPALDQGGIGLNLRRVPDVVAARRAVSEQGAQRADWVTGESATSVEIYRAIVAEARSKKLRSSAAPGAGSMAELARTGVTLIDRLGLPGRRWAEVEATLASRPDFPKDDRSAAMDYVWAAVTPAEIRSAAAEARRYKTAVAPQLASFAGVLRREELEKDPAVALLPAAWRAQILERSRPSGWKGEGLAARAADVRAHLVVALQAAGVALVTASDPALSGYGVPGAGIHRELSMLVSAGLSPAAAISAATTECAAVLGATDGAGTIRRGAMADFFVVDGDPLRRIEDLRKVRLVVRRGEVLDPKELLAQARRAAR